jgi:hypothetical protein
MRTRVYSDMRTHSQADARRSRGVARSLCWTIALGMTAAMRFDLIMIEVCEVLGDAQRLDPQPVN